MTSMRPAACLLAFPALLFTLSCHPQADDQAATAARNQQRALAARQVRLVTPEVREEHPIIDVVGEIRAFELVNLPAEVGGTIDRVLVEIGDRVRSGQPLVEIDRSTHRLRLAEAEAGVAAAEAELAVAERELERKQNLLSDQTIPQAAYDRALAGRDLARARLAAAAAGRDLARHQWERSVLRAPRDGVVARREVAAGEWADAGKTLLELATGDQVKVVAVVPQGWATRLSDLSGFELLVADHKPQPATLYSIAPVLDGGTRSFEVVAVADDPDRALRPGMFCQVRLTSPQTVRALWLPATAIAPGDMATVMVAAEGRVAVERVRTGRREGEQVEIVSGLEATTAVIAEVAGLQRGTPVEVVP